MFVPGASKREEFLLLLFKSLVTDAHREVSGQGSELGSCPVFKPFQKAAKEQLHLRLRIVFLMMTVPYGPGKVGHIIWTLPLKLPGTCIIVLSRVKRLLLFTETGEH